MTSLVIVAHFSPEHVLASISGVQQFEQLETSLQGYRVAHSRACLIQRGRGVGQAMLLAVALTFSSPGAAAY